MAKNYRVTLTKEERDRNEKQKGINWQFTAKDARIKLKRLDPSIIT